MNDDQNIRFMPSDAGLIEERGASSPRNSRLGGDGMTYPVGFFNFTYNESNGSGIGGLLITDNTGIPLEFVVTTAVRSTPAQRILYGKRLRSFIAINLCAKQLLQNVKTRPKVLFVRDDWQLGIYKQTEIPVLQLIPSEQIDDTSGSPTVLPPDRHPEYVDVIDLMSLDVDMIDAFDRIEACRRALATKNPDYVV